MLTMFRRRIEKAAAERDAARLIEEFGGQAHSAAGEMSWREDAGLLASRSPGHWHRVQQEIGRLQAICSARVPMVQAALDRGAEERFAGLQ